MKTNEAARIELLKEVDDLSNELLNKKPAEDRWSIGQILEHLYLMEEEIITNIEKELASDRKTVVEEKPIHLTVNRKYKVAAPEAVHPTEQFKTLGDLKQKLENSRNSLIELIKNTDEKVLNEKAMPHPGFKALSLAQWITFIGWHERRHLEQIQEVKAQLEIL